MANEETKTPTWNSEDIACRNTYTLLIGLKQLTEAFTPAGKKQMKQLAFWNKAASHTLRRLTAAGLGAHLDKFYMKVLLAEYEDSFDFHRAIETLADTLCSADSTLFDLAQTVDAIYHFRGET